jgi:2-polyprenyl-3-methyl-5-hydroxy-6-metoxy-1,4-benzoquinol methylase
MTSTPTCWCGQAELADFSPDYLFCESCHTLVLKNWPPVERFDVFRDAGDLYGHGYYVNQATWTAYGDLPVRARNDLNERCMDWMRTVLKYRLPPARTLEVGCGHGGFVALMRWAGFDATGLELSPWLVEYAKSAFGVPMLFGKIEEQEIEPHSLDLILQLDVLERLPDPLFTTQRCMELLKPDGLLIIQTPCFPADRTYDEMVRNDDLFLEQFKPAEHFYLFSRDSIAQFFSKVGAPFVYFEPAIFDDYDMFVVASPRACVTHTTDEATEALLCRPGGRIVQALLDANSQHQELVRHCQEIDADREARLHALQEADARITDLEADREARLQKLLKMDAFYEDLARRCKELEADREAIERVLLKMDASYKLQMSYRLARLFRRLQAPLKMDALYKAMEERLASGDKTDGASAAR